MPCCKKHQTHDKNMLIAKTLLYAYPRISEICTHYEKMITFRACASIASLDTTQIIAERILDQIWRKHILEDLREQIKRLVSGFDRTIATTTSLFFLEKWAVDEIARHLRLSKSSIYRHIEKGVELVAQNLNAIGINFFTWRILIRDYKFILREFEYQENLCMTY